MKTIEYTNEPCKWVHEISGLWQNEPDKIQWQDETTKLPCLIVRHKDSGHLCGYVGVAEDHALFGLDYSHSDVEKFEFQVHGGLTFASKCQEHDSEDQGICHIPDTGETDNVWWFGFDAMHAWDTSPGFERRHGNAWDATYKSVEYMKLECAALAQQLINV